MKNRYLLKVVSGKYRGRGIISPKDYSVRPTSQRVKESLFNIIRTEIYGKNFLDIFSGTGQMGIEAISNGAKTVFVDADIKLLKENISAIVKDENPEFYRGDFKNILKNFAESGRKFDFIFADPPYDDGLYEDIIKFAMPLLNDDGMLILEHSSELSIENENISDIRSYGSRTLTFLGGNKWKWWFIQVVLTRSH